MKHSVILFIVLLSCFLNQKCHSQKTLLTCTKHSSIISEVFWGDREVCWCFNFRKKKMMKHTRDEKFFYCWQKSNIDMRRGFEMRQKSKIEWIMGISSKYVQVVLRAKNEKNSAVCWIFVMRSASDHLWLSQARHNYGIRRITEICMFVTRNTWLKMQLLSCWIWASVSCCRGIKRYDTMSLVVPNTFCCLFLVWQSRDKNRQNRDQAPNTF